MPGRPCTPEAGVPTEPASAPVDRHGYQFRRGVDQPDYARLLRQIASFDRAVLQASVTRRATLYGVRPLLVSFILAFQHSSPRRGAEWKSAWWAGSGRSRCAA